MVAAGSGVVVAASPAGLDSKGVVAPAELVCAPPLLLIETPGAICVVEEVAPTLAEAAAAEAGFVAAVDAEPAPPGASVSEAVGEVSAAAAPLAAGDAPVASAEELAVSPVELDESAVATPGAVTTIIPIPRAAASAPTRPMYRP